MATPKELLTEWSIWMLRQDKNTNDTSGDTAGGTIIKRENENGSHKFHNDTWFIPGTWGQIKIPDRDRIAVPEGTKLFIIVASSHVTQPELPNNEPATPANMTKHLAKIDKLWLHSALFIGKSWEHEDGDKVNLNRPIETDIFDVNINPNSQYAVLTRPSGGGSGVSGNQKMMTSAIVHLFQPPLGETFITLAGQSRRDEKIGPKGEVEYNIHVRYKITVVRPQP